MDPARAAGPRVHGRVHAGLVGPADSACTGAALHRSAPRAQGAAGPTRLPPRCLLSASRARWDLVPPQTQAGEGPGALGRVGVETWRRRSRRIYRAVLSWSPRVTCRGRLGARLGQRTWRRPRGRGVQARRSVCPLLLYTASPSCPGRRLDARSSLSLAAALVGVSGVGRSPGRRESTTGVPQPSR